MTTTTSAPYVRMQTEGGVSGADAAYLQQKVTAVLRHARGPVLFARARLTLLPDSAVARPALAQVNVNLNGRFLRAQAARESAHAAVDEVHDRLQDRLHRATVHWEAIRGAQPSREPHEWRHTSAPTDRPQYYPLPAEERQIVRHKAFGLRAMTVDEAAFDLARLGYQFHLFTEAGTGRDSVLYLVDDDPEYRLAQVDPQPDKIISGADWVSVSLQPPPVARVEDAVARLNVTGWPFVFFQDAATGRGSVIYHRYDGHYGLITPAG